MNSGRFRQRVASLARRVGWGRNPLRRRSDRIENAAVLGAIVLALASVPLALEIGSLVYHDNLAVVAAQHAADRQIPATLLQNAAVDTSATGPTTVPVTARWTRPDGKSAVGQIRAPEATPAGSVVRIWTDASGNPIDPPLTEGQAWGRGALASVAAVLGLGVLLACAVGIVHSLLNRRRIADWDTEWRQIGPQWTRHTS